MALVPYTITVIERDTADAAASGKQVVVGAVCSMFLQPADTAALLYDNADGDNGSTAKTTNSSGQVTVWVDAGDYRVSVNGNDSFISLLAGGTGVVETVTETQTLAAAQTVVTLVDVATTSTAFYINGPSVDNGRLVLGVDYTVDTTAQITLSTSYADGTLITAVQNDTTEGIKPDIQVFDSVFDMQQSTIEVGKIAKTKGYYTPNDGGGAEYLIVANGTGTDDGGSYIDLALNQAELIGTSVISLAYGSILDGVADDTVPIKNWIRSGKELVGVERVALLSTWTEEDAFTGFKIKGNGLKLKSSSVIDFMNCSAGDFEIDSLVFDGWQSVFTSLKADVGVVTSFKARNNTFKNTGIYPFNLNNETTNLNISNNIFEDLGTGAIKLGENIAANQDDVNSIVINSNVCKNVINAGAGNTHFLLALCEDIIVTNNQVENVSSNTGESWGIYTKAIRGVISNNIIKNITSTSNNSFGINMKGENSDSFISAQAFNVLCFGNVIVNDSAGLAGINANQERVSIYGNDVKGYTSGIISSGINDNVLINNNTIEGISTASPNYGIRIFSTTNNLSIQNNNITDVYMGVRIDPATACNLLNIQGNTIKDFGLTAFFVSGSETISDINIAQNIVSTGQRFCFTSNTDKMNIVGNTWEGLTDLAFQYITFESSSDNSNVYISNNTPLKLQTTTGSSSIAYLLALPQSEAAYVDLNVTAVSSTNRAIYNRTSCIYRLASTSVLQGATQSTFTDIESNVAWDVIVDANSNAAQVRVIGDAAETVNWSLDLTYNSVGI
jgi:hypothetical protein